LAAAAPGLRHLLVGADWRFGRGGRGDVPLLRTWAAAHGCAITGVPPVLWHGDPVSSTRVRQAITHGHLPAAAAMLGRPFSLLGEVRAGLGLAAHLGFPTANLDPEGDVRPPRGVYAVRVVCGPAAYAGVANYGVRPTLVADSPPVLEVHLLDAASDLYGRRLEAYLFARLRPEERFDSPEALRDQIARDAATARSLLDSPEAKNLWTRTLQTWHPSV
jgi:riboflavin kinase/FMN adenylyltransferase